MYSHQHVILQLPAKFRTNQMIGGGVMTSYLFFKTATGSHIGFDIGYVTQSVIAGLSLILKFGLDSIYISGDTAIFIFFRFSLKLPIHAHFWGFWGHIFPKYGHPLFSPQKDCPVCKHVV